MTYKLTRDDNGVILDNKYYIPFSEGNNDYKRYLEWRSAGNIPLPADPPPAPTQDTIDAGVIKSMAKVQELINLKPENLQAWVNANITNVAQARDVIMTIILTMLIIRDRLKA